MLIDNYDSFTYNLVHAIEAIVGHDITVKKNDKLRLEEIEAFEYLILSPGPGLPEEAGLLKPIIQNYRGQKKILGVCLGQQAIAEVYGCSLKNLATVHHGIKSDIQLTYPHSLLFKGLPSSFPVGRYHSWVIDQSTIPAALKVSSIDQKGQVMSIEDEDNFIYAVQYHPESIMTPSGNKILENFLNI